MSDPVDKPAAAAVIGGLLATALGIFLVATPAAVDRQRARKRVRR